MIQWLKDSKAGVALLAIVAVLCVALAAASGCSLGDMVRVPVPSGVREATGAGATVTFNESNIIAEQWNAYVRGQSDLFAAARERGAFMVDLGGMLLNIGMAEAEGPLSSVPGGGVILALLAGAGGILMRKPGDGKAIASLKEALQQAAVEREKAVREAADKAWDEAKAESR